LIDRILYRDDHILVIDKPAGIPVHAGSGGGENLEDHFPDLQLDAKIPPMLAHRLDRDTSGCLILGRTKQAIRTLGKLFEQKRIGKTYWAIVEGIPDKKQGRIDAPLAKISSQKNKWHMKVDPSGQESVTDYRVMGSADGKSWLELTPRTGRTHQIRVHCAHMGWPLMGDKYYGSGDDTTKLMLHARAVKIPYDSANPLTVEAPPPPSMASALEVFGFKG
jgi:RluA family pseudouridine synthase